MAQLQHIASDNLERQVVHNINPFPLAGPFGSTTPSMASQPGPAIRGPAVRAVRRDYRSRRKGGRPHPRPAPASQAKASQEVLVLTRKTSAVRTERNVEFERGKMVMCGRPQGCWMIRTCMATFIPLAIALGACFRPATARELSIEHVTVVSAERSGPLRHATVVVRDERITSVTASGSPRDSGGGVDVIDGTGLFLSPGLIDSHVHTNEIAGMQGMEGRFPAVARALREQLPRSYLYFRFTTLVDVIHERA
jgi:hypothetical protein